MLSCWAGATRQLQSAGNGKQPACRDNRQHLRDHWLYAARCGAGLAALCNGSIRDVGNARHFDGAAAAADGQPSGLRSNRHAAVNRRDPAARIGNLIVMDIAFPLHFDARGRTASAGRDDHIRQMIKLLLFTSPGERVNRPDFGCGLQRQVFAPNSPEIGAVLQMTVHSALERWLGDLIEIRALSVDCVDSRLTVTIDYAVRATGILHKETFAGEAA